MIVIHVDTMEDTSRLKIAYEGLENVTLLYNPTKERVIDELQHNEDPLIMCLGHGTSNGLFSTSWFDYIVDDKMAKLLRNRKMIGIWCYASQFGERNNLHGFFTSMFVSNIGEATMFGFPDNTNEDILNEIDLYCEKINTYLKANIPMDQWVDMLQESGHMEKDFVAYNYEGLRYFE